MKANRNNSRSNSLYALFFVFLFGCSQNVWSQRKDKKEDVETITAEANRQIPEASRIADMPKVIDTVPRYEVINYSLLSVRYNTSIQVDTIKAANVILKDKLAQLYKSYVRVGIGYPIVPLADFYFNNSRSRKYIYGASLNHLSGWGKIKNYAPATFDRTKFKFYGGIFEEKWDLKGNIHGNYRGLNYYGVRNENISKDSIRQRYNELGVDVLFRSHVKDSAHLNYNIGINYTNLYDRIPRIDSLKKWRAMENYFEISPTFSYRWKEYKFGVDIDAKINAYRYGTLDSSRTFIDSLDTGLAVNNFVLNVMPNAERTFFNQRLKTAVGVHFNYDGGIINKFRVYPYIDVQYHTKNGVFNPYFRLDGGLHQNTFRAMSYENEFILSNQQLRNTSNTIRALVGMRGSITNHFGYNIQAEFGVFKDYLLFVNDSTFSPLNNKFRAIYDTVNIAKIEGSLYYQLNEKIKLDVIGRYYSYIVSHEIFAWNKPDYEFIFRGSYNLYDKFIVSLAFDIQGGRKAKVDTILDSKTIQEEGVFAQKLGLLYDIDLHLEYRYNPRISFFVDLNNLAANKYNRWLNYPVYGFQAMAGATFRF